MQKTLFVIFIFVFSVNSSSAQYKDSLSNTTKESHESVHLLVDTLKLQTVLENTKDKTWYKDENMPWLIALIISFLGLFLNVYISRKQIKATLGSSNRQDWINETRSVLAELARQSYLLNIELQDINSDIVKRREVHGSVKYYSSKLMLLLKQGKHDKLLEKNKNLMTSLDHHLLESNSIKDLGAKPNFDNKRIIEQIDDILIEGRNILYSEWGKIQSTT